MFCKGIEEKYPKTLLENRQGVEANIIACLWKDPLLFEETSLTNDDFITHDGRFYFALGKALSERGFHVFDEATIISNSKEAITKVFMEKGGMESITTLTEIIDDRNYDTFMDVLNRENVLVKLYDRGFRVDERLNELRKLTADGVIEHFENILGSLEYDTSGKGVEVDDLSIDDDFIESCMDGNEMGVAFDFAGFDENGEAIKVLPGISREIGGYLRSTLNMIAGHSSTGKSSLYINIISALIKKGEKVLIISNEQKAKPFKIAFLCWIVSQRLKYYGLTKKKILNGQLDETDKKMIQKAKVIWQNEYAGNIRFVGIPDANMSIVKKYVRQSALKDGFTCFLYDTLKIEVSSGKSDNFWLDLIIDSRILHTLASKYNMIGLCSIQLASNTIGQLFLNESCLSTSKQVIEIMESALMIRNVFPEELDEKNKYYCKPFWREKNEAGKWVEKKVEIDMNSTYKMIFLTKCRNGENSNSSGVAYLLRFYGSHGVFHEICMCRPKNANISKGY